jgi:hypothetical protein
LITIARAFGHFATRNGGNEPNGPNPAAGILDHTGLFKRAILLREYGFSDLFYATIDRSDDGHAMDQRFAISDQ